MLNEYVSFVPVMCVQAPVPSCAASQIGRPEVPQKVHAMLPLEPPDAAVIVTGTVIA